MKHSLAVVFAALGLCAVANAQYVAGVPNGFQVRPVSYLDRAAAFVNITNNGAGSTVALPTQNGSRCANLYATNPATGLVLACCSCAVQPGSIVSVNVLSDLLGNVLPPANSTLVKMLVTEFSSSCSASGAVAPNSPADGLVANLSHSNTGTALNPIPFSPATLSAAEYNSLFTQCAAKPGAGGACAQCRQGAN